MTLTEIVRVLGGVDASATVILIVPETETGNEVRPTLFLPTVNGSVASNPGPFNLNVPLMPEAPAAETNGKATTEHRGIVAMLLHELFGALKPVLIGLITSHFAPPPEPETENEHPPKDGQG